MKLSIDSWTVRAAAAARREVRRISGDVNILLVLLAGPLVYGAIFGLVYQEAKVYKVPLIVVDRDQSSLSRTIIRALDSHESLRVIRVTGDAGGLPAAFRTEECWGAVEIPRGFEKELHRGGGKEAAALLVNSSNIIISNYVQRGVQTVMGTVGAGITVERLERQGAMAPSAVATAAPVGLQAHVLFNPTLNYAHFVVPLLLILLIHQVVLLAGAMSWAGESAPCGATGITAFVAGKSLPYVVFALFWLGVEGVLLHSWLRIPFRGSVITLLAFAAALGVIVALIAAALGTAVKSKVGVVQIIFFTSMPLLLISGGSWPLEAMPAGVRWLAELIPATHLISAYRRMALAGAGIGDLLPSAAFLLAEGTAVGLLLRWQLQRARARA